MSEETSSPSQATPEQVIKCLKSLPDETIGSTPVRKEVQKQLNNSDVTVDDALKELVVLDEAEIYAIRGTGARVRLKRHPSNKSAVTTNHVWKSYAAEDYETRYAYRVFQRPHLAFKHLEKTHGVSREDFEEVSYLEGVWTAERSWREAYETVTLVVRREPVFGLDENNERRSKDLIPKESREEDSEEDSEPSGTKHQLSLADLGAEEGERVKPESSAETEQPSRTEKEEEILAEVAEQEGEEWVEANREHILNQARLMGQLRDQPEE